MPQCLQAALQELQRGSSPSLPGIIAMWASSVGVLQCSAVPAWSSPGSPHPPAAALLAPVLCLQVAALGCSAFALLFDDIDPCMCRADRDVFPSLAQAQASVANEAYRELGLPPTFLFCPTGTPPPRYGAWQPQCAHYAAPSTSSPCRLTALAACGLHHVLGQLWRPQGGDRSRLWGGRQ